MEILQAHQTKNRCYKKATPANHIGILVHSTGAVNTNLKRYVDAPDRLGVNTNGNHWNKERATKAVHAFIGRDKNGKVIVVETLPLDIACWGAGKGKKGSANYNPQAHIQFEICEGSMKDKKYYREAITVAEEYCVHLCKLYGWSAAQITSHYEAHASGYANNHGDPRNYMEPFHDSMAQFRARVQVRLDGAETAPGAPVDKLEQIPVPSAGGATAGKTDNKEAHKMKTLRKGSKGTQVRMLQYALTIKGYGVADDGIFGNKTKAAVEKFQKDNGLAADGIAGPQTWAKLTT